MAKNKSNDFNTKKSFEEKEVEVVIEEEIKEIEPKIRTVKSDVRLRVRDAMSTDGNILRHLEPDTEVAVYEEENGWSKISKDSEEYVMTDFLA